MEKKKILYDIREAIRAYSKDVKITNAYILHLVNTVRAKYIRQEQSRHLGEDKVHFTQTLLMETEVVDRTYIPSISTNLTVLRTKKALPQIIGKDVLKNMEIRPIDRIAYEIEYMDKDRAIYGDSTLFIFAFLDDDYHMYFVNKNSSLHKMLKKVAITTILFQPDDITALHDLTEELVEYPITGDMWALVKSEVMAEVTATMKIPVDADMDNQTIQ